MHCLLRKLLAYFFIASVIVSFSCAGKSQDQTIINNGEDQISPKSRSDISKESAVQKANDFVSNEYNLSYYDVVIMDENEDTWNIGFAFKPRYKGRTGGQPTVEVDKKTGSIGRYYFPKQFKIDLKNAPFRNDL